VAIEVAAGFDLAFGFELALGFAASVQQSIGDAVRSARCRSARLRALRRLTMSPIPHSMSRSGD